MLFIFQSYSVTVYTLSKLVLIPTKYTTKPKHHAFIGPIVSCKIQIFLENPVSMFSLKILWDEITGNARPPSTLIGNEVSRNETPFIRGIQVVVPFNVRSPSQARYLYCHMSGIPQTRFEQNEVKDNKSTRSYTQLKYIWTMMLDE
jgi:hypothetical protein